MAVRRAGHWALANDAARTVSQHGGRAWYFHSGWRGSDDLLTRQDAFRHCDLETGIVISLRLLYLV